MTKSNIVKILLFVITIASVGIFLFVEHNQSVQKLVYVDSPEGRIYSDITTSFYNPTEKCRNDNGWWEKGVCYLPDGTEVDYDPNDTARTPDKYDGEFGWDDFNHNLELLDLSGDRGRESSSTGHASLTLSIQDYIDHQEKIKQIIGKEFSVSFIEEKAILEWNEYTSKSYRPSLWTLVTSAFTLDSSVSDDVETRSSNKFTGMGFSSINMTFYENWCTGNDGIWDDDYCEFGSEDAYKSGRIALTKLQEPKISKEQTQEICNFLGIICSDDRLLTGYVDMTNGRIQVPYTYNDTTYEFDVTQPTIKYRIADESLDESVWKEIDKTRF